MALSFDGPTKRITLSAGTTTLSVLDLWSRWVDWCLTGDNSKFLPAFATVGGDDIDPVAGTRVPVFAFLRNNWRIKPQETDHTLTVTDGVLLVEGGGDPFVDTDGAYTVRIRYQQPVQAITLATGGGGSVTDQDKADIASRVLDELVGDHAVNGSLAAVIAGISDRVNAIPSSYGLKRGQPFPHCAFAMVDAADHVTPKSGLVVKGRISRDGGAFSSLTNSVIEVDDGIYCVALTGAEMDGAVVVLRFSASGADPQAITLVTVDS